jgi:hypothetical protein
MRQGPPFASWTASHQLHIRTSQESAHGMACKPQSPAAQACSKVCSCCPPSSCLSIAGFLSKEPQD